MKTIPLTQGKVALVDDADYNTLAAHKWYAQWRYGDRFYAVRAGPKVRGSSRKILMHVVIARTPVGMVTDHVDGDGLNNQRGNLRICTSSENGANRGKQKNNTSGFKGVIRYARRETNPWQARIHKEGKNTCLGKFPTAEAAARAYDKAALKQHGAFASLNFPIK